MARAGRKDRGLLSKLDSTGKPLWYVRLYHEGKERRFGSFKNKTEARDFYDKAKQEQKQGRFFPERYQHGGYELIGEEIARYLSTATAKKAYDDEAYFAAWWTARFTGKRLNAITPETLEEARQDLLKTVTPQRVNRYLAWLRHVLNISMRDGRLTSNAVVKLKMFKEPKGKTRFLSPEDETKLMTALGDKHGPWARLAILTGMRLTEQFSLRWNDVDLDRGLITLPDTKAGGVQYVPLNDEAKALLRRIQVGHMEQGGCGVWVFPSENPKTYMDPRNFYARVWVPAIKAAGIEWATWHDLRHTFASRLAMNGETENTIATLLRHSSTALVRRYAHLSPSHLQQAIEGISAFGQKAREAAGPVSNAVHEREIQSPTVTGTGKESEQGKKETTEDVVKIGGPDTN